MCLLSTGPVFRAVDTNVGQILGKCWQKEIQYGFISFFVAVSTVLGNYPMSRVS